MACMVYFWSPAVTWGYFTREELPIGEWQAPFQEGSLAHGLVEALLSGESPCNEEVRDMLRDSPPESVRVEKYIPRMAWDVHDDD